MDVDTVVGTPTQTHGTYPAAPANAHALSHAPVEVGGAGAAVCAAAAAAAALSHGGPGVGVGVGADAALGIDVEVATVDGLLVALVGRSLDYSAFARNTPPGEVGAGLGWAGGGGRVPGRWKWGGGGREPLLLQRGGGVNSVPAAAATASSGAPKNPTGNLVSAPCGCARVRA